jgi:hypothetical protein
MGRELISRKSEGDFRERGVDREYVVVPIAKPMKAKEHGTGRP